MIAREAVLNDAEVARLLRDHFVCIAIDNVDHPQLTPIEKEFLSDKGLKFCTQGMSAFTAGGKVLATGGGFEAQPVRKMLAQALAKYQPEEKVVIPKPSAEETAKLRHPPEGGLILYVTWKVLGGYDRPESSPTSGNGTYDKTLQDTLGVDRLWVRRDEAESLIRGELPDSLKKRILPHLSYVCAGQVKGLDLTLNGGRLTGSFQSDTGDPGRLLGYLETKAGRVTRFDLLMTGVGERVIDCGFSAGLTVVPKGQKVPVAVYFTLADPRDDLSRVVPHRAGAANYLK